MTHVYQTGGRMPYRWLPIAIAVWFAGTGFGVAGSLRASNPGMTWESPPAPLRGTPPIDVRQLDRIPQAIHQTPPVYPKDLHRKRIGGFALVDFIVDQDGSVKLSHAVVTNNPEFGANAAAAVAAWQFIPGERGGQAVNTHMVVPLIFSLGNGPPSNEVGRLSGFCDAIITRWIAMHRLTAWQSIAVQYDTFPCVWVVVSATPDGHLHGAPAVPNPDPRAADAVAYADRILARVPTPPDVLDFVRAMPGIAFRMPIL